MPNRSDGSRTTPNYDTGRKVAPYRYTQTMECRVCGQTWHPMLRQGGRMPRGYRHCPNGCEIQ